MTRSRRLNVVIALCSLSMLFACGDRKEVDAPITDLVILPKQDNPKKAAIIFVHGVLGNAITTFGESAANNWPRLLADDSKLGDSPYIASLAYTSPPIGRASNINEIATRLLVRLIDKGIFKEHDKVIFITHSMGGLVTKRMLVQLSIDAPSEYKKVHGVFFLATPAGGATLAEMADWLSGNPQFSDMRPEDFNTFLQSLEDDWQSLLRGRSDLHPYPMSYCVYETLPLSGVSVVPRSHSQLGCDERPVAFDRNHIDLVKPASREDEVYVYVATRVKRLLSDEYLPLSLSASLLKGDDLLPKDAALRSGDQYAFQVLLTKPAWVYMFSQDSTGKIERYFPSKLGGQQDSPSQQLRIPADNSLMFNLDNNKGLERFYFFATLQKSAELEQLYAEVSGLSHHASSEALEEALVKRGATVQKRKQVSSTAPQRFSAGSIGSEAAAVLYLEHL